MDSVISYTRMSVGMWRAEIITAINEVVGDWKPNKREAFDSLMNKLLEERPEVRRVKF